MSAIGIRYRGATGRSQGLDVAVPVEQWGAGTATALFLLTEGIFGRVADRIWATLSVLYGSLALAVLLLSWSWYVALITLACGGFASHIKVMILERRSATEAGERHVHR